MFDDFKQDLRQAARVLRASPGFALVAIASLAVGIGANAAIFSALDALMFKALPVRDPSRLVVVSAGESPAVQYSTFEALERAAPDLVELTAIVRSDRYNVGLSDAGGRWSTIDSGPVRLALVSGNYFSVLGTAAAIGRAFAAEHDRPGADPVVVISDAYWESRFARAPDVVGRVATLNDTAYEIIGVMPKGFAGEWVGRPADLWIPIVWQPQIMVEIPVGGLANVAVSVVGRLGRLPRGASMPRAEAALQAAYLQDQRERLGSQPTARQLQDAARQRIVLGRGDRGYSPQRGSFGPALTALMVAVGLVLFVACANIANLLLARASARQREMAVRLAIGAGRGRLIRQLLTESLVLATLGGLAGLAFARWATDAMAAFTRGGPVGNAVALSMDLDVHLDARFFAFTAALCLVTGVLVGIVPAFRASGISLAPSLTGRGADTSSSHGHFQHFRNFRSGRLLVVAQVAISLVLLMTAGLLVRTLRNLSTQDLGFDRDRVMLVWTLPGQTGGRGAAAADFWRRVLDALRSVPGVVSVSASNQGVLNGSEAFNLIGGPGLRIEGETTPRSGLGGLRSFVAPEFFKTMGIPLVAGRDFTEKDASASPRVVIISRTLARHYFDDANPVGRRIWFPEDTNAPTEVIGVASDFIIGTPRETAQRPATTYFSYRDREAARRLRQMTIAVRTSGDARSIAGGLRQALRDADPSLPVLKIDTVDQQLADVLVQERLLTAISGFFGALALLLACLGLYGVVSYTVARRTSEIGIRMAMGATAAGVLRLVLRDGLLMVTSGIVIGVPAAFAVARLVASRLFGISAADPLTMAAAIATMAGVTAIAAIVPALRAARVDPMLALRSE